MDLRKPLRPLNKVTVELQPPEQIQNRAVDEVIFEAPVQSPLEAPTINSEPQLVPPPLESLKIASKGQPEAPKGIPELVPVQKSKNRVELPVPGQPEQSPPQPAAEISAAAEPVETGGDAKAWPFTGAVTEEKDVITEEPIQSEIPALEIIRSESTEEKIQNLPPLDTFRTMEVVHMLLGKCEFDGEIILLRTYAERDIRPKSPADLQGLIYEKAYNYVERLVHSNFYDFYERNAFRKLETLQLSPQQKQQGVEMAFVYRDSGKPSTTEVSRLVRQERERNNVITEAMAAERLVKPVETIFSFALVKVRMDNDFTKDGGFKLSELMPDL